MAGLVFFCFFFFCHPAGLERVTSYSLECVVELNSGDSGNRTPMSPHPCYVREECALLSHRPFRGPDEKVFILAYLK